MSSPHLSTTDFFAKLTDLFNSRQGRDHGSIFLTQKRYSYNPDAPPPTKPAVDDFSDLNLTEPLPILIHATDGNGKTQRATKVKLSTIVKPEEMEAFFTRYADVCKAGMIGLKKRDRKGRKAKKRKGAAPPPAAGAGAGKA